MPLPVTDDLRFHFDFSDSGLVVVDGSGRIELVMDKSPNAHHATQASAGNRPYFVFDSISQSVCADFSQGEYYLNVIADPPLPAGRTFFVVFKIAGLTGVHRALLEQYPNYFAATFYIHEDNRIHSFVNDGSVRSVFGAPPSINTLALGSFRWVDDDYLAVYNDLGQVMSSVNIGNVNLGDQDGWRIGTYRDADGRWFDGQIFEMIMYDQALSDEDAALINSFLREKWNLADLAWSLPTLAPSETVISRLEISGTLAVSTIPTAVELGLEPSLDATFEALSATEVQVTFSEPVEDNIALRNISNYVITPHLQINSIDVVSSTVVVLNTEEQTHDVTYQLQIHRVGPAT